MKKLITSVCLFYVALSAIGQVDDMDYSKNGSRKNVTDRITASVSMGAMTGFSKRSSTYSYSYNSTYIAPAIGYQLTKKFTLNAGFIHYTIHNPFLNELQHNTNIPYSGNLIQIEGNYQFNERMTVSGGILYNIRPGLSKQTNYKAATLGLDYKVAPHTTFSIRTTVIQGNSFVPNEQGPFNKAGFFPAGRMYDPFYNSPFNF